MALTVLESWGEDGDVYAKRYEGRVIRTWERNGYHDSDFYATIWVDEIDAPREFMFNTTRFGGGGDAVEDATPEVMAKWEAWKEARAAEARARLDAMREEERVGMGLSEEGYQRFERIGGGGEREEIAKLLRTEHAGTMRSEFRKSLAAQARSWCEGGSGYGSPLSPRQWEAVMRYHRPRRHRSYEPINMIGAYAPFAEPELAKAA